MRSGMAEWAGTCLITVVLVAPVHGAEGPTMARLAHLMEGGEKAPAIAMLRPALTDPDPRLRAAAARVIHVINLREVEEDVRRALAGESDPAAAREQIRTLVAFAEPGASWETLAEQAVRIHPTLRASVLVLAARRDGPAVMPLLHRWESTLTPAACEAIARVGSAGQPGILEAIARRSLAAGQSCGWAAALAILRGEQSLPPEPLLLQALAHHVQQIREEALVGLMLRSGEDRPSLTPSLMAAMESKAEGEEAFLRELLLRAGGRPPHENDEWVSLLRGDGKLLLDDYRLRQFARSHLTGKEHAAAVHRWDDMRFPSRPWPFGKAGELPLKMTLADLPAGMAQAVFQDHECKMPRQALLASARVSYGSTGRPASVELMQMKVGRECHEAVILLLRAGLSPDDARPPLPAQALTVYVPLGGGQETRFDEIPPGDEPSVMDGDIIPPHRHHFVKPAYPEEMRQARTEGKVVMLMVVDRDGVPGNIRLLESADARFDRSAVHAVTQWRYKPALRDGVPLNALLTVIVDYNLR